MKERTMTGLYMKLSRNLVMAAIIAFGAIAISGNATYASKGDLATAEVKANVPLRITLGKADVISLPDGVSDILVANPSVIDVQAVQSNKLYIVGLDIGDTNIIVLNSIGDVVKRIDIHVTYDLLAIQSLVNGLFPKEDVKVGSIHDQILLTGTASNPEAASKIANLVGHYVSDLQDIDGQSIDYLISNLIEVRGEQQVMLQVKIVEASRGILKELSVDTTVFGNVNAIASKGYSSSFGGAAGLNLSQDPVGISANIINSGVGGIGNIGLFIDALDNENLINVLAEPNLTAISGQQAGFLAGGEFPVPTGRDQDGNVTIEFREFGVSLNFRPVVLSEDRISLQLETEVSSLDRSNAVVLAGLTVPGLDIRRADTTVEMPSGGSLMIAGLLQSETAEGLTGLPGIKNTPILGDLISSDSFRRSETEMVVIVTPYLVEPYSDKEKVEFVPVEKQSELSKIFKANIRRMFDIDENDVFASSEAYGYITD